MKKPVLLILVLGNLFLFCSAAVADGNDRWRQLMDAEITGASTGFQRWHIIQPMTLVAKPAVGDVEYAALASLLQLQLERGLPPVEGCLRNLPIGATGVIAERKRVEDYRVMVTKREKNWLELRMRLAGKSDVSSGTVLVGYLAKLSSSPREAAKKYLEEQLYQYKAVSFPMNEEWSKLLLDSGIPFIVKTGSECLLCLGYAEGDGVDMALLVDCGKIKTQSLSIASLRDMAFFSEAEQARITRLKAVGVRLLAQDEQFAAGRMAKPDYVSLVPWPKDGVVYAICQPYPSYPLMAAFCKGADATTLSDDKLRDFALILSEDDGIKMMGAEKYRRLKAEADAQQEKDYNDLKERERKVDGAIHQSTLREIAEEERQKLLQAKRVRESEEYSAQNIKVQEACAAAKAKVIQAEANAKGDPVALRQARTVYQNECQVIHRQFNAYREAHQKAEAAEDARNQH